MFNIQDINEEDLIYNIVEQLLKKNNQSDTELAKRLSQCYLTAESYIPEYYEYEYQGFILTIPEHSQSYFNQIITQYLQQIINDFLCFKIDFLTIKVIQKKAPANWRIDTINMGINNQTSFPSTYFPLIKKSFNNSSNVGRHITMNFRSPAEEVLFDHFYKSDCLFFPCPLGFSNKFNDPFYKEPDYLVCKNGKWAILEVVKDSTHSSVELESKRTRQFQDLNIQIRHYDYNRCLTEPATVVNDFLLWLSNI